MTRPLALLLLVSALAVASCGVSRGDDTAGSETQAAGSETDATGGETDATAEPDGGGTEDTTATSAASSPPTTGAPDDVAASVTFTGGEVVELRHGELNEIVVPTQENTEFVDLVYAGTVPAGFDAAVLSQTVLSEVIGQELANAGGTTTDDNRAEAKELLFQTIEGLLTQSGAAAPTSDAERLYEEVPYLPFLTELQARQIALSSRLAETAEASERYPCVRHILVETEAEAAELLVELEGGADFAALAEERSTGPSGPSGGDLGCAPSAGYVPEFATAVDAATEGEPYGPVETEFGWHVLVVEGFEANGEALADEVIRAGLAGATIEVDDRVGSWDVELLMIVPAGS